MGRPSKYPEEFREAAVEMVRETGKPIAHVARELGVNAGTLGNWVAKDRRERGEQPDDKVTETERIELVNRTGFVGDSAYWFPTPAGSGRWGLFGSSRGCR